MKSRGVLLFVLVVGCVLLVIGGVSILAAEPPGYSTESGAEAPNQRGSGALVSSESILYAPPSVIVQGQVPHGRTNLRVQVLLPSGSVVDETRTGPRGWYGFRPLPAGHYRLRVLNDDGQLLPLKEGAQVDVHPEHAHTPTRYILPLASSNPDTDSADLARPSIQATQVTVIQATGTITGVVTAADTAQALSGVWVTAYNVADNQSATAWTDLQGRYSLTVPTGTYKVEFDALFSDYALEWYDDKRDRAAADPVFVTDGAVTPDVNAALEVGGKVSGQVTDAPSSTPLQGVTVRVFTNTTSPWWDNVASDFTDASGLYTITRLLSDTYYVMFDPPSNSDYLEKYYDEKSSLPNADPVAVGLGDVVTGVNGMLDKGGKITGQVTSVADGSPVQNVTVRIYTDTTSFWWDDVARDTTDAAGLYTITQLLSGTYYLMFDPPFNSDYLEEFYDNKPSLATADPVPVSLNTVVTDVSAALATSGKITGQVTAEGSGTPLQDVVVTIYRRDECNRLTAFNTATTGASGAYTVTGLATGNYWLAFRPMSNGTSAAYLSEYYDDKPDLETADAVSVTQGLVTGGIDAALTLGGGITGRLTAHDGDAPLKDVGVSVHDSAGHVVGSSGTDANGMYTHTALMSGTYRLSFDPYDFGESRAYLTEYYNDKATLDAADPISVTLGSVTSGVDGVLTRGAQLAGRVTTANTANPLEGVFVAIYDGDGDLVDSTSTDASGVYTTPGLLTDTYRVRFRTQNSWGDTENYIQEYYDDKATLDTADPLSLTVPNVSSGIDAVLVRGGKITGTVTAEGTGAPLGGVRVGAYDGGGAEVRYDYTDFTGNYAVTGLPTGHYRVRFDSYTKITPVGCSYISEEYAGGYYNDKQDLASADVITVTAPDAVGGINAALGAGSKIFLPVVIR